MKEQYLIDTEIFPPFEGFTEEALSFLRKLKKNNNRSWFSKHKDEYESYVKFPMLCLIASLKAPMARIAPEIDINPKRNMFRIYRDVRFSGDKAPYKTHVAAVFHLRGHWQDSAGFYLHVEPGGIYAGGGVYMPDSSQLKLIRRAISENSKEFLSIVESPSFKNKFKTLEGDKLQRAPLGYEPDDPMIEWLKFKSFYTGVEWSESRCFNPRFVEEVARLYKELLPFIRFLNRALGKYQEETEL